MSPDAIARGRRFAIEQPADVDVARSSSAPLHSLNKYTAAQARW